MFYNISANFLKHYCNRNCILTIQNGCRNLVSYAAIINVSPKQSLSDTLQVEKHLKPLISRTVNEILSEIDSNHLTPNESVTFLKALRIQTQFNNIPPETFRTDSNFQVLCDTFQRSCKNLNSNLLIAGLRCLLEVGMPADSPSVVSAENEILLHCCKFNTSELIRCIHFHQKYFSTNLQKRVVNTLREELLKKLSEISTSGEVLLLCQIVQIFSEENRKKIESKIVELVPLLNVSEMCKVMISLAQISNRNVIIINAISFYMRQRQELPSINETVDLLYALKKLNFVDYKFLSYLINPVIAEVPTITQPSLISGLLTTCGHLKWKHTDLLDSCTDWIKSNFEICRTREMVSFILTTATLNYSTSKSRDLLQLIVSSSNLKEIAPNVLLDVTWSLAILNCLRKDLLLQVLSEEFYKPLLSNSNSQVQVTNKLKLMNLKGVLKMKYPEHIFGCSLFLEPIKLKESSEMENSRKHVINVLSNFVPLDKCLCTSQSNDMGLFIDAEFIMDKNIKPLPLSEFGVIAATTTKSKVLPKGAKRFALLVLFHKDYTQKIKTITGINSLATKLLTHNGYSVLQISYEEFLKNTTEVQKAKYLMQKIKMLMQNSEKNL